MVYRYLMDEVHPIGCSYAHPRWKDRVTPILNRDGRSSRRLGYYSTYGMIHHPRLVVK